MNDLASALASTNDRYSRPLRRVLFDSTDPQVIAEIIDSQLERSLSPVDEVRFVHSSVGLVIGAVLRDGLNVVLKVHRWNVTLDRLVAVQRVQRELAIRGMPAPKPLLAPTRLAAGFLTAEEFRSGGSADGHRPAIRAVLAAGLANFVESARLIVPKPSVGNGALTSESVELWGVPHDARFDFEATATGAEWIDDLATFARRHMALGGHDDVVAHLDWRIENLGFVGDEVTAIYDWDSVGLVPEPVAVGQAAAQFSTDWRVGPQTLPSLSEMRSFVWDYEVHRGCPFDTKERALVNAANLLLIAYGARCQHSDRSLYPEAAGPSQSGWEQLLRGRGREGLL